MRVLDRYRFIRLARLLPRTPVGELCAGRLSKVVGKVKPIQGLHSPYANQQHDGTVYWRKSRLFIKLSGQFEPRERGSDFLLDDQTGEILVLLKGVTVFGVVQRRLDFDLPVEESVFYHSTVTLIGAPTWDENVPADPYRADPYRAEPKQLVFGSSGRLIVHHGWH